MPHLRIVVADDEPLAVERLLRFLARCRDVEVVATASNGEEALALIRAHQPDAVLLDIKMPLLDGFDVIEQQLGERTPVIIFVTAFHRFAIQAFEVAAADYLLKPVRLARLEAALDRARAAIAARSNADTAALRTIAETLRQSAQEAEISRDEEDIWVPRQGEFHRVPIASIDWIKAEGVYVRLWVGGQSYLYRELIGHLAERLPSRRFLRIHRSVMVRRDFVTALRRTRYGSLAVRLADGTELPVGRKYATGARALVRVGPTNPSS